MRVVVAVASSSSSVSASAVLGGETPARGRSSSTSTSTSASTAGTPTPSPSPSGSPSLERQKKQRKAALRQSSPRVGENWPYLLGFWNLYILGGTVPVYVVLLLLQRGVIDDFHVEWHMWVSNAVMTAASALGVVAGYALSECSTRAAAAMLRLQVVNIATPLFAAGWSGFSLVRFSRSEFFSKHEYTMVLLVCYCIYGLLQCGVWIAISVHAVSLAPLILCPSQPGREDFLLSEEPRPPPTATPCDEDDPFNCANPAE
eukprot:TRINITY_DN24262_c0_g1_i1.p1 TRINITY_DN24262_c0_g1~~TRINITY_DN24262_c0_g1_i1.p1  ORF type:complete len:280 (+),score=51.88 TRINITY_DN24262_c0_g1_i1:65-841(+)